MTKKKITYKNSGVDIEAGQQLVESVKDIVTQTYSDAVLSNPGGFGGFFRPDLKNCKDPVFVSSVDGVGTKLIVAFKAQKFNTVGRDLVNHCVNDIAVCGADPLFFLDYFSTGTLNKQVGYEVIKGFAAACKENNVALIGGETAEMPDIYRRGEFDLAGTIVGLVDKNKIIDGNAIQPGDLLLGFKSNGLHTNGYSLARKVLFSEYGVNDYVDELQSNLGEALMRIHKSYLSPIKELRQSEAVHGFSHITGGGIEGNTKRIIPEELSLQLNWNAWQRPPIFNLIKDIGNVPEEDMRRTFNLGIGLIAVVDKQHVDQIIEKSESLGEPAIPIGSVQ